MPLHYTSLIIISPLNGLTCRFKKRNTYEVGIICSLCPVVSSVVDFTNQFSIFEPQIEISDNVVCATSNASDQPAHTRSLIRAFTNRLIIL